MPALAERENRDISPDQLLADSLYGSDENCEKAEKDHGVKIVSPVMPGNRKKMALFEFTLDDKNRILSCPQGCTPNKVKRTRCGFSAVFPLDTCRGCDVHDRCPVSMSKKASYFRYSRKDIRLAIRKKDEDAPTFREEYRYRAGV